MPSARKDEQAALVFDDLASALDAGLPLESLGGNPALGDHVLLDLCWQRGIELAPAEKIALETAWRSGTAGKSLRTRSTSRRQRAEFTRELWRGLRYPLLLLVMLAVASVACSGIMGIGFAVVLGCVYAVIAVLVFVVVRGVYAGSPWVERVPLFGSLMVDLRELPYLDTLHTLYGAGVTIVDAHADAVRAVRDHGLRRRLAATQDLLGKGEQLGHSLRASGALTSETRGLLDVGERAGQLEDSLQRALVRRREIAHRKLSAAARTVGHVAYGVAVVGIVLIVYFFYSALLGTYSRAMGR